MNDCEKQLLKEREKLDRLVNEALKNGTPIYETHGIIDQSQRVDKLVEKVEEKRGERRAIGDAGRGNARPVLR